MDFCSSVNPSALLISCLYKERISMTSSLPSVSLAVEALCLLGRTLSPPSAISSPAPARRETSFFGRLTCMAYFSFICDKSIVSSVTNWSKGEIPDLSGMDKCLINCSSVRGSLLPSIVI